MSIKGLVTEYMQDVICGTCMSQSEAYTIFMEEFPESNISEDEFWEHAEDSEVFLCDVCGWWYPIEEQKLSGLCEECSEDCS